MSSELFCYFTHEIPETKRRILLLTEGNHKNFFADLFVSQVVEVDEISKVEISDRYGIAPNSLVLVEISKSSAEEDDAKRLQIIKDIFGVESSCILFDGNFHMRL